MEQPIADANERLSAAFLERHYILGPTEGVIDGTTVRDRAGRYLFAWHRNPRHLLFYLRRPALDAKSTLRQKAIGAHSADSVNENTIRETTITLRSAEETEKLLGWLLPALPLP